tara:strand:- start:787 stop:1020 length:234 start_codon:yes stop_codon:yes gene_type:complete
MIFQFIDFKVFLISLSIGLLYIYLSEEYKKVVVIYPTPDNVNKYIYKDNADNCFSYKLDETQCPSNSDKMIKVGANY